MKLAFVTQPLWFVNWPRYNSIRKARHIGWYIWKHLAQTLITLASYADSAFTRSDCELENVFTNPVFAVTVWVPSLSRRDSLAAVIQYGSGESLRVSRWLPKCHGCEGPTSRGIFSPSATAGVKPVGTEGEVAIKSLKLCRKQDVAL